MKLRIKKKACWVFSIFCLVRHKNYYTERTLQKQHGAHQDEPSIYFYEDINLLLLEL